MDNFLGKIPFSEKDRGSLIIKSVRSIYTMANRTRNNRNRSRRNLNGGNKNKRNQTRRRNRKNRN